MISRMASSSCSSPSSSSKFGPQMKCSTPKPVPMDDDGTEEGDHVEQLLLNRHELRILCDEHLQSGDCQTAAFWAEKLLALSIGRTLNERLPDIAHYLSCHWDDVPFIQPDSATYICAENDAVREPGIRQQLDTLLREKKYESRMLLLLAKTYLMVQNRPAAAGCLKQVYHGEFRLWRGLVGLRARAVLHGGARAGDELLLEGLPNSRRPLRAIVVHCGGVLFCQQFQAGRRLSDGRRPSGRRKCFEAEQLLMHALRLLVGANNASIRVPLLLTNNKMPSTIVRTVINNRIRNCIKRLNN